MHPDDKKIIVGHFGAAFGIRGWLKVFSYTQPEDNILDYQPWQIEDLSGWTALTLTDYKIQGKGIVVKLEGCDDPETARFYTNKKIAVERAQLPKLPRNQYYWSQLEGLRVINQDEVDFGMVEKLIETGSNDVLVVQGERQRLIPYISSVIIAVDLKRKIIRVDWESDF